MNIKRNAFPRIEQWQTTHFSSSPFDHLLPILAQQDSDKWPCISELASFLGVPEGGIQFLAQINDERYYEQIVFEDKCVPTRSENWHDFYNACIWRLFPKSKQALNHLHIQEIQQHGLKPRTPRRDRITHFDECGVVLAFSDPQIPALLKEHEWRQAFVAHRLQWGKKVKPFVLGHANYEMLMQPHIGLTGKWFGVQVEPAFWHLSLSEQYEVLDEQLLGYILQPYSFTQKSDFRPLPLLGVPDWFEANQDPEFYQNTQYFRPKRK